MDIKPVVAKGGSILAIKGLNFALIAANTLALDKTKIQKMQKTKLIEVTPVATVGMSGSLANMVLFRDILLDIAGEYRKKNNTYIPTDFLLKEISKKLHELPRSPTGINCVLAGLDTNGQGIVQLFDTIGFFDYKDNFCSTGDGQYIINPILFDYMGVKIPNGPNITANKAIELAHYCFKCAFKEVESIGHHVEAYLIKDDGIEKNIWDLREDGKNNKEAVKRKKELSEDIMKTKRVKREK